jgi:hypothetical protein
MPLQTPLLVTVLPHKDCASEIDGTTGNRPPLLA